MKNGYFPMTIFANQTSYIDKHEKGIDTLMDDVDMSP
jgi:hypothetical protein